MPTPAPAWVTFDANPTRGLDLLGLRAPVQAIGNELMNGLTTVTPKLRYLSILAWVVWRYLEARLPNDKSEFIKFAAAQEAVIVMTNVLRDKTTGETTLRLIGVGDATELVNSSERSLPLNPLVQNIAFNIYASASRQLGLTFASDSGIHGLSEQRGLKLAHAFDATIGKTGYGKRLTTRKSIDRIPRRYIEELSEYFSLDILPPGETKILVNAILPTDPVDAPERQRLGTFALLLWLASQEHAELTELDVFATACEPPRELPEFLREVLDGWLGYLVRDVLAVVHEAVFGAVMNQVDVAIVQRSGPAPASEIVANLLNAIDEHDDQLREFNLLGADETVRDMSFQQITERVRNRCGKRVFFANGLRRWNGGLSEHGLSEAALGAGKASAALLPVAWCLVEWRVVSQADGASVGPERLLSIGDIYQIGLEKVVLPKLDEYRRLGSSYMEVMADLIIRTAQQHLRVAWQRFAAPNGNNISVLVADMENWSRGSGFNPGRTDSRLSVAIDWLRQLKLIGDAGITPSGREVLARAIRTHERA